MFKITILIEEKPGDMVMGTQNSGEGATENEIRYATAIDFGLVAVTNYIAECMGNGTRIEGSRTSKFISDAMKKEFPTEFFNL